MDNLTNKHGATVRGAMTPLERKLTFSVMVVNLGLGAWFLQRSDFSGVRANGSGLSPAAVIEPQDVAAPAASDADIGTLFVANSEPR